MVSINTKQEMRRDLVLTSNISCGKHRWYPARRKGDSRTAIAHIPISRDCHIALMPSVFGEERRPLASFFRSRFANGNRLKDCRDGVFTLCSKLFVRRPKWNRKNAITAGCLTEVEVKLAFDRLSGGCCFVKGAFAFDGLVAGKKMTFRTKSGAWNRVVDSQTNRISQLFFGTEAEQVAVTVSQNPS